MTQNVCRGHACDCFQTLPHWPRMYPYILPISSRPVPAEQRSLATNYKPVTNWFTFALPGSGLIGMEKLCLTGAWKVRVRSLEMRIKRMERMKRINVAN